MRDGRHCKKETEKASVKKIECAISRAQRGKFMFNHQKSLDRRDTDSRMKKTQRITKRKRQQNEEEWMSFTKKQTE